jgi:glycosyltransferase involved in cell wall biosynthesis
MQRICTSVAETGFEVWLIGRKLSTSTPLPSFNFRTKRLSCFFNKGFAFYAEYNIRLFFYLLFSKAHCLCAIDLDTIVPIYFVSWLKNIKRVYDAHELFTEQKEIVTRPKVHKIWMAIEQFCVPKFKQGYTVNLFIKDELKRRYGVNYSIIRNMPVKAEGVREKVEGRSEKIEDRSEELEGRREKVEGRREKEGRRSEHLEDDRLQMTDGELESTSMISLTPNNQFLIYQGAVNEGRSFETLIPAMKQVNCTLLICGEGNFFEQTQQLIQQHQLEKKVILRGYVSPAQLKKITPQALFGLTLFEKTGLNQYYSLSNRFFDYIMAGIPQVCVGYPEYKAINDEHEIALLIDETDEQTIANGINRLINNTLLYKQLQQNCIQARTVLNWNNEAIKLKQFWKHLMQTH